MIKRSSKLGYMAERYATYILFLGRVNIEHSMRQSVISCSVGMRYTGSWSLFGLVVVCQGAKIR